jgi:hypothetical protein
MEQIELYKGFRIRAHEERPGRWLAEARKAGIDSDADWIATPSGHPTPEAAIDFIKQMINSPSTRIAPQLTPDSRSVASFIWGA